MIASPRRTGFGHVVGIEMLETRRLFSTLLVTGSVFAAAERTFAGNHLAAGPTKPLATPAVTGAKSKPATRLGATATNVAITFQHPGLLLSASDLATIKSNLNVEPWKSGYTALKADSRSQLTYAMQGPFATVSRSPDVNLGAWKSDMQAVYNLARMGYFLNDAAYSQKARDILIAWATTQSSFSGAEPYLSMGDYAYRLFGGADILRGTWSGWTVSDTNTCKAYFNNVYWSAGSGDIPPLRSANQGELQLVNYAFVAAFNDDQAKMNAVLKAYLTDVNGGLPNSLPNGEMGDTGRDQGHSYGQLISLTQIAEIFWKQGVDVYSALGNRLLAIGEYYSRYNAGVATPYMPFGAKYDYYLTIGGAPNSSAKSPDPLNLIYNHYVNRMGMSAPYTQRYMATRPQNSDSFVWYRAASDNTTAVTPPAYTPPAATASATSGFLNANLGSASPAGSSGAYGQGAWTVKGAGTDIWGASDSYHFTYKQVSGDFTMIAKLTSFDAATPNAKAGIVLSDGLTGNATRRVFFGYQKGSATQLPVITSHQRGYTNNSHNDPDELTHDATDALLMPHWLKIERTGTRIRVYHCTDGASWTPLQEAEYAGWTGTAYVGMGVASGSNSALSTATFTDVRITGGDGAEAAKVPAAPYAVYAAPGNGQVPLRWLSSFGATRYVVKRSTTPGGPYATVASTLGTSYADSGLTNGTTYYYVVTAANAAGESGTPPEEAVTPLPPLVRVEAEGYTAQSGVQTEACSENTLDICFISNSDWTRYNNINFGTGVTSVTARVANPSTAGAAIEVRLDSLTGPLVVTIAVPVTGGNQTWVDAPAALSGATGVHTVYLKYVTGGFNVNWFQFQRLDGPAPIAAPPAPANAAGMSLSPTQVNLSWQAAAGAASYRIKRAPSSAGPYTIIADTLPGTTFTDTGLNPYTTYFYAVSAVNVGGESGGTAVSVKTQPTSPPPTMSSSAINDYSAQRSRVMSVTLTFDQPVAMKSSDLTLLIGATAVSNVTLSISPAAGLSTQYSVLFGGSGLTGGSLTDGRYTLVVNGASIVNGSDVAMATSPSVAFHRLYGDIDGNALVNFNDYLPFQNAFNSVFGSPAYVSGFDADASGVIDFNDFLDFQNRFGIAV